MSCRFPKADSVDAFWQLLREGTDAISEVPAERWSLEDFYSADGQTPGKMSTRWGGFVDGIDRFDAGFFGIAPREAMHMSPQQRLLLEVAWESLEDASLPPLGLAGKPVGVFVGVASFDYYERFLEQPNLINGYTLTGNAYSVAANRLSYVLDLRGPSVVVDTACSSSLVSVHLACQSLQLGESDLALAGGTHAMLAPWVTVAASKGEFMAPDGRCKTFDARANGYVRGEGTGLVVLKRLEDALRDGDRIRAVIRGSAVNQDGLSNGLTAPNPQAQVAVLKQAYRGAGVEPKDVGYVEAHGTGTRLGDPMELNALGSVLAPGRSAQEPCWVGAVKTNIGHLEAAAGIAGLIKTVLVVEHGEVPPNLHFETPNPLIPFAQLPLAVPRALTEWKPGRPRIAGVSSFGFGGTNAHVVVAEAPARAPAAPAGTLSERTVHLLCLSSRSEGGLRALASRQAERLAGLREEGSALADVAFSAGIGRSPLPERLAVVARTPSEAAGALSAFSEGKAHPAALHLKRKGKRKPRLAFLFTGQGAQYVGMARALHQTQPVFRDVIERCDQLLAPLLGRSLLEVLYAPAASNDTLRMTALAQPALFSLQVALAEMLRSFGVVPSAVLGHSIGEFAAAHVAGVLSLEDALRLIAERGRLMQALDAPGAMAAVFAEARQVLPQLVGRAEGARIAAYNSASNTVISGPVEAVAAAVESLRAQGLRCQPLSVSHAFHSRLMEPAMPAFGPLAAGIPMARPKVPWVSTLLARSMVGDEARDPGYWVRHALEPVRFMEGLGALHKEKIDAYIELGPRPVLTALARDILGEGVPCLPLVREGDEEGRTLFESLGQLFTLGAELDWRGIDQGRARQRVAVAQQPFQRERYWLFEHPASAPSARTASAAHPMLARAERSEGPDGTVRFRVPLGGDLFPYLGDHRIFGAEVLPATGYIEIAQAAVNAWLGEREWVLEDLEFRRPFFMSKETRTLDIHLRREGSGGAQFSFENSQDASMGDSRVYVFGRARPAS
ncbi:polyketide synthase [Corallococcus coralloides DSM 2259]|uniref:Polyketide synthase n=2 Tax=Corallococcus coralloides TaxID=184914 RepID=H8MRC8_CORCM|nr:polyketide synthase [Corallococcus coralloides DSM 2259]